MKSLFDEVFGLNQPSAAEKRLRDQHVKAWDKAAREGKLNPVPVPPDTRPRNSLTGKLTTFNAKITINGNAPWADITEVTPL